MSHIFLLNKLVLTFNYKEYNMYLPSDQSQLFCLETVADIELNDESKIFPFLEQLVLNHSIVNVYKACDSIEGFEDSLNALLYEDRNFKNYDLLYFVCKGSENEIEINGYYYSLEEIAELFEDRLKGKILHFANSKALNLDDEACQYFIDVTGAKAISGYTQTHGIFSGLLDYHFFGLTQEYDDVRDVVETLYEKHYGLCTTLGFHLYY